MRSMEMFISVSRTMRITGKLSGRSLEDMQAGARIDIVEEEKPFDFALWKKAPEGEKIGKVPGEEAGRMAYRMLGHVHEIPG